MTGAMNGKPNAAVLDRPRARRDAAKVLGVALQSRYRKLLSATGEDETVVATADLAQCMYENIEFVIWALKHLGGMSPPPPEALRKVTAPQPANDSRFAKPPAFVLEDDTKPGVDLSTLPCTCPPLEPGIITANPHMTNCPKYVP
jgi:hypothetical protein